MRHDKRQSVLKLLGEFFFDRSLPAPYDPGRLQTNNSEWQVSWLVFLASHLPIPVLNRNSGLTCSFQQGSGRSRSAGKHTVARQPVILTRFPIKLDNNMTSCYQRQPELFSRTDDEFSCKKSKVPPIIMH